MPSPMLFTIKKTKKSSTKKFKGVLNAVLKSRATILTMVFKLGQSAEKRWRKLRGFKLLADIYYQKDSGNLIFVEKEFNPAKFAIVFEQKKNKKGQKK